jgi:hypothetical protein
MTGIQWARLSADVDCSLRRGAWYRVRAVGGLESTVEVGRKPQSVPSYLLQIVTAPPRRWTVVPRPDSAVRMPREWKQYAVCPCQNPDLRSLPRRLRGRLGRGLPRAVTPG